MTHILRQVKTAKRQKGVFIEGLLVNPVKRDLRCMMDFCVDTGATITVIPRKIARKLRLKPSGTALIQLADGRKIQNDLCYVYLYIANEGLVLLVAITDDGEALLGCDVMELLRFQVDIAQNRILKPVKRFKIVSMLLQGTGKRLCEILSNKH